MPFHQWTESSCMGRCMMRFSGIRKTSWKLVHLCIRCKSSIHLGGNAVVCFSFQRNFPSVPLMSQFALPGHNLGGNRSGLPAQTSLKQLLCSLAGSCPRNTHRVSAYPVTGPGKQQYEVSELVRAHQLGKGFTISFGHQHSVSCRGWL